jgi:hypothetical protein
LDATVHKGQSLFDAGLGDDQGLVPILRTDDGAVLGADNVEIAPHQAPHEGADYQSNNQGAAAVNGRFLAV